MTKICIVGNLTADPELKFTQSGAAVASFTIADTPRIYDKSSGEFKDGETTFWRCTAWRDTAENLAESLTRGTRVVAYGETKTRSFETNTGEKRSVTEVTVEEIGPSLRYATAKPTKTNRGGSSGPAGWESTTDAAPF